VTVAVPLVGAVWIEIRAFVAASLTSTSSDSGRFSVTEKVSSKVSGLTVTRISASEVAPVASRTV
jgi:hypothetical protein